jgi:serine/threonine-protein kinase HipA
MDKGRKIFVYLDRGIPLFMGTLYAQTVRGRETFSFEGGPAWTEQKAFLNLDPELKPFKGRQYLAAGRANFGIFLDSTPDRWGRRLLQRREKYID